MGHGPIEVSICACSRCVRGDSAGEPLLAAIAGVAEAIAELAADVRRTEGALVLGIRRLHQASGRPEGLWWTDAIDALDGAAAARAGPGPPGKRWSGRDVA